MERTDSFEMKRGERGIVVTMTDSFGHKTKVLLQSQLAASTDNFDMTWKPEFDPISETSRARVLVSADTRALLESRRRNQESLDQLLRRLVGIADQIAQLKTERISSRGAARVLKRLRDAM